MEQLRKGNLCFLTTSLVDLIYIVQNGEGEEVRVRKMDAPPSQKVETLSPSLLIKLADEQEKLLPPSMQEAIEKQRRVVFTPVKKGKKKLSLDKLMKGLNQQTLEDIFQGLAEIGVTEKGEEI
jgi:hypothetical protein